MYKRLPKPRLIDDSAFLIQREKPHVEKPDFMFRSKIHTDWIHTLPCCRCQQSPVQAAHIRYDTQTAKGVQPHDFWEWPGCPRCHLSVQHIVGEITYWVNLCAIADPHRHILKTYALRSPCKLTVAAATAEYARRYGDSRPLSAPGIE